MPIGSAIQIIQVSRDLVCELTRTAMDVLKEELQSRFFSNRPSNSRLVLGYMSKQSHPSKWLTPQQIELARTCYLMMIRQALELSEVHNSTHSTKKQRTSPRLQKKRRSLIDDSDSDDAMADAARATCEDASPENLDIVSSEVERWKHLPRELLTQFTDSDGIINEFQLFWSLRNDYPLHFIVFKQCAAHLLHEANVEKVFSSAGRLADPSLDPANLETMVRIQFNKKAYQPSVSDIKTLYFRKYRKNGDLYEEQTEKKGSAEDD